MNREIKFRAWDKIDNKIVHLVFPPNYAWFEEGHEHEFELMQYTGLKDKNGREIYEGDIVEYEYNLDTQNKTKFSEVVEWEDYSDTVGFTIRKKMSFEIIGNIYEHPELINQTTHA